MKGGSRSCGRGRRGMVQLAPWTQPPSTQSPSPLPLIYWFGPIWRAHEIAPIQRSCLLPSRRAPSISCCGQCHFPNLKKSSISIDFSSLNCYLLRKVCPVGSVVCLAQEAAGFACLKRPERCLPSTSLGSWADQMQEPGAVVHAWNPSTGEAGAGGLPQAGGQHVWRPMHALPWPRRLPFLPSFLLPSLPPFLSFFSI